MSTKTHAPTHTTQPSWTHSHNTTHTQDEGFDFDAHVARLMEASAKETGLRQRTADDDLETKGLARLRRDSDSDSDSDDDDTGSDDSGEIDDTLLEGLDLNGGGAPGEGVENRAVLDSQFEAVSHLVLSFLLACVSCLSVLCCALVLSFALYPWSFSLATLHHGVSDRSDRA